MSKSFRNKVAKLLFEKMQQAKDPKVIVALANSLAKFEVPKQPRRSRGGTQTPKEVNEIQSVNDIVAAIEKKRKGLALTETEEKMIAAVEKKRNESAGEVTP